MKKLFIVISLFTFTFSLLTLQAQDTLVLRNGKKMVVKVISVTGRVIYSIPPGDRQMSIRLSKVNYIKYKDGSVYTNNDNSGQSFCNPYLVLSGGVCSPIFQGYGGNSYNYDNVEYAYSGYASTGSIFSVTGGINFYKGWEFTGMFSYIRNQFDASGVMNETKTIFLGPSNPKGYAIPTIYANARYYYSNYSTLLGISKNWENKFVRFGFTLMAGDFITYIPTLTASGLSPVYSYVTTTTAYDTYTFTMNSETRNDFVFEMGLHLDFKITHQVFIRLNGELQLSGITNGGGYQIIDENTGAIHSGTYAGYQVYSSGYNISLANATIGVGYKF